MKQEVKQEVVKRAEQDSGCSADAVGTCENDCFWSIDTDECCAGN